MSAKTTTKIAHFSVHGEGLTDIVRNIMLSERPGQAYRIIANHLIGEGTDKLARELLDGKRKLVGIDNLEAKPDNAKAYIKDLKYIYAGRVRIEGSWWRPKAEVVRFGPKDMRFASCDPDLAGRDVYAGGAGIRLNRIAMRRVAFYAGRYERVVETIVASKNDRITPKTRYVIFETCGEPPFWWEENNSLTKALEQFLAAGRKLEERGANYTGNDALIVNDAAIVSEAFADGIEAMSIAGQALAEAKKRREEEQDREYAEQDKRWRETLANVRQQVLKQTAGDMLELKLDGKLVATVPRIPFVRWAMNRTKLKHLSPPWETVSPSGLKMQLDDRDHSDWFFASTIVDPEASSVEIDPETGGPLRYPYHHDSPLEKAASDAMWQLQKTLGRFECTVIVDGPVVTGVVDKDILVIPNLHPDFLPRIAAMRGYLPKFVQAKGLITEAGGKLAHLALVAMEKSIPVMLMPGACEKLRVGDTVTMDPSTGRIAYNEYDILDT
jgi:phosphohistidine swiveling domain-containing protein